MSRILISREDWHNPNEVIRQLGKALEDLGVKVKQIGHYTSRSNNIELEFEKVLVEPEPEE